MSLSLAERSFNSVPRNPGFRVPFHGRDREEKREERNRKKKEGKRRNWWERSPTLTLERNFCLFVPCDNWCYLCSSCWSHGLRYELTFILAKILHIVRAECTAPEKPHISIRLLRVRGVVSLFIEAPEACLGPHTEACAVFLIGGGQHGAPWKVTVCQMTFLVIIASYVLFSCTSVPIKHIKL